MPLKKSSKKKFSWKKVLASAKHELLQEAIAKWLLKIKKKLTKHIDRLKTITNVAENNYRVGIKHYNLGNYEDAILRFKIVIKLEPNNHNAHYWLGVSQLADGKKKPQAIASLKQALFLKPDFLEAQEFLKLAQETDGKSVT